MNVSFTICDLREPQIGNTPLVHIGPQLYAKNESGNPSGSIKDRMAAYILDAAERDGRLQPGGTIVEATSGNTGIALAMLAARQGYGLIIVMPSDMSPERKQLICAFRAQIVEVAAGDFRGAVQKRDKLVQKLGAFNPDQFANPLNVKCHHVTTGREILGQTAKLGEISAIVAGTGTGGTLMGVRAAVVERFSGVKTVAVEPAESAVMSGGKPGPHLIQGIGDGFLPCLVDMRLVDEVIVVSSRDAIARTLRLTRENGLCVGISSGANVLAAEQYIAGHQPPGIVVTVLPDSQDRYSSMLAN